MPTGWLRTVELEARIRQTGFTPLSLMKRSASLAKLDCLELSANDLSDLDLRPQARTRPDYFSTSLSHPDDNWKKQKVWGENTCVKKAGPSLCISPAPHCGLTDDTGEKEEPDGDGSSVATTIRQQGRAVRRPCKASAERKQGAVNVLYNTM